jgi:hypothetical protein
MADEVPRIILEDSVILQAFENSIPVLNIDTGKWIRQLIDIPKGWKVVLVEEANAR